MKREVSRIKEPGTLRVQPSCKSYTTIISLTYGQVRTLTYTIVTPEIPTCLSLKA